MFRQPRIAIVSLSFLAALLLAGSWIAGRETTLQWVTAQAAKRSNGALEISGVRGSLYGPIRFDTLTYRDEGTALSLNGVLIDWSPLHLLRLAATVDMLHAKSVTLTLPPASGEPPQPPDDLVALLRVSVPDARIERLLLVQEGVAREFENISASLRGGWSKWKAELKTARTPWGDATAALEIGARAPFPLHANVEIARGSAPRYAASAQFSGSLSEVNGAAAGEVQGAQAEARFALTPFQPNPVRHLELNATGINPRSWQANAPVADLRVQITARSTTGKQIAGEIAASNASAGTLDQEKLPLRTVRARFEGEPANMTLPAIRIDVGEGGQIIGDGAFTDDTLKLALTTANLNLHGWQQKLRGTRLAGDIDLSSGGGGQRMRIALKQERYQFELDALLARDALTVYKARAQAGDGELSANATIAFSGTREFKLGGTLQGFNPAEFGDYPSALLNSRFTAAGEMTPVPVVSADLKVYDSQIFGESLSVTGRIKSKGIADPNLAVNVRTSYGATMASADGILIDPQELGRLDLKLTLQGQDLAHLYKIVRVPMPPTAPYRLAGRLIHEGEKWEFRQFAGAVGNSDLAGNFMIERGTRPQFMRADVVSRNLEIKDLAGFLGADPKTQPAKMAVSDRVLPDEPFDLGKLHAANADIKFKAKRIVTRNVPLEDMNAHLKLQNGKLDLDPLNFGAAGGVIVSHVSVDARRSPIASAVDVEASKLRLEQLSPGLKTAKASTGEVGGRAKLTTTGNSVAQMLASANGDVAASMKGGTVSDLVLRLSNLDIANTVAVVLRGDQDVPLRCMVASFRAEDGVMNTERMVLDTAHTYIHGSGTINFRDESLDLTVTPQPKGMSLAALRGPILVRGRFKQPTVRPELAHIAARVGVAATLGVVATPAAALVPLVALGDAKDADCDALLAELHEQTDSWQQRQR